MENNHWEGLPENWYEYEGFVYCITNKQTNQKYIGRKYFFVKKKTKIVRESDWREYTSSSKKVNAIILENGKDIFSFQILSLHRNRQETNYAEVEEQIKANVLRAVLDDNITEAYYNDNIMSKYFRPRDFGTPEYYLKCQNISVALKQAYKNGTIIHPLLGEAHPNKGKSLPQTGHNKNIGYKHTEESKKKMSKPKNVPHKEFTLVCCICGKEEVVGYRQKNRQYCSDPCKQKGHSIRMKERFKAGLSNFKPKEK